jgi:hypothetical protein
MPALFSKRSVSPPDAFRDDIPEVARKRIFHILEEYLGAKVKNLLDELEPMLEKAYGFLDLPGYVAARVSNNDVLQHFVSCSTEKVLDFLELCFQTRTLFQPDKLNQIVDDINDIFREYGIRYEFTPFSMRAKKEKHKSLLRRRLAGEPLEVNYPRAIVKDDELLHNEAVVPCLKLLRQPAFRVANEELMASLAHYRCGRLRDAITDCGAAFETVLKTICHQKRWTYNADKDTCAKLVGVCRDNGLFPGFYAPIFEATGTIRNKLGDAHGQGPAPRFETKPEHVEHILHMTCSHILLLIRLAELNDCE